MSVTAAQPAAAAASSAALPPLRLATRRSALALAQSRAIGEQLAALTGRPLELVEVTTQGDVDRAPLAQIGGTGVFVAAVREALADGRADIAVHSLKDLPTAPDPRLVLGAVPVREDPRDALIARDGATLADLPIGARVGTGSPRRRAQLAGVRPDLELVELRGNVDTRLGRVLGSRAPGGSATAADAATPYAPGEGADLAAVVLATAGLTRLGRASVITEHLDPEVSLPAPGQGALAVEIRASDLGQSGKDTADPLPAQAGSPAFVVGADPVVARLADALRAIDDAPTRAAVTAERAVLATLQVGCSAPVGALGLVSADGSTLQLHALVAAVDGTLVRRSAAGPADQPESLGRMLALELLADPVLAGSGEVSATPSAITISPAPANPATTGADRTSPAPLEGSPTE